MGKYFYGFWFLGCQTLYKKILEYEPLLISLVKRLILFLLKRLFEHMIWKDFFIVDQMFKYHGSPKPIVLDRDPRMKSLFCKGIFETLGTIFNFSLAYCEGHAKAR